MSIKFNIALAASAASTWVLKSALRRPAANFPGKAGLVADRELIRHLRPRIREGSIVVVGTNGKTTTTNMLADILEEAGKAIACNRTGANMDSGVASALLKAKRVDWGVLECDELWLAKVAPQLEPDYVVLLNLFRDQLDRMGEIEHIQSSIAEALASSPNTTLLYNCDDPLCQSIADAVENRTIAFGIAGDLGLPQNAIADAGFCQVCGHVLEYAWRQYGQLGSYRCPHCGFARANPAFAAHDVKLASAGVSLTVRAGADEMRASSSLAGAYTAYNLVAVCAAARCCNVVPEHVGAAIRKFSPGNGRLERYEIDGCDILLNLAKNPTGFNQNLRIVEAEPGAAAVAFFVNDKEADGRDVSWLWDVDFQELARREGLEVFAGGTRRNDVQVRLKYAGIRAELVDGAADFIAEARGASPNAKLFLIANYTALPPVKAELDRLSRSESTPGKSRGVIAKQGQGSSRAAFPSLLLRRDPSPSAQDDKGEIETCLSDEMRLDCHSARNGAKRMRTLRGEHPDNRNAHDPSPAAQDEAETKTRLPGKWDDASLRREQLVIAHLYPELLNLYGDGGNVTVLERRANWRGIAVEVVRFGLGDTLELDNVDIAFLGGGPDSLQRLASRKLLAQKDVLRRYVEDDGVLLAICGGYQILGRTWVLGDEEVEGLGILDVETKRAKRGSRNRLVGNIALQSPLARMPVVGYENHAGRTHLAPGCQPFGNVIGHHGKGNDDTSGADGVLHRNVVATYLHGPLLAKNPEVADFLITRALDRRAEKEGRVSCTLPPLDDEAELEANAHMCRTLGIR